MWISQVTLTALIGASCLASTSWAQGSNSTINSTLPSLFISPSVDLIFSLNVPNDSPNDLYFSLAIPSGISWGAVGLGSDKMAGSLILLAYSSASGQNVTLSPRLASGHSEPVYTPAIHVEALAGTGLVNNDTMLVFNGRCSNCRSWNGGSGSVDVTSRRQSFLFATGPGGDITSDDPAAPLKMHANYGTFTLDMVHATGPGAIPVIPAQNVSGTALVAATQGLSATGHSDIAATLHAIIMVFCFVGMFPFGILILRLGNWVRWHAINQGLALVGVIIAFGLGIHISFFYNRSKNFTNPHQILGIFIFIFIIGQFLLGFFHHRSFKKTQERTKLAPIHVWLGRITILLGVVNAFLGFPFAQSKVYNWILAGLVIFIFPVLAVILITKKFIRKRLNRSVGTAAEQQQGGYDMEPWRQTQQVHEPPAYETRTTVTTGNAAEPALAQSHRQPDMASYAQYQSGSSRNQLGPQQAAREYV